MLNSVNRMAFPGLATGLDTNQIIRDLMRVERLPLDRLNQQRQIVEWQREDYREINRLFTSLRTKADGIRFQGGFLQHKVTSTNEMALSSSVVGTPSQSMYSVEVTQLAQAGKHASATFRFAADHPAQKLSEAVGGDVDFRFTINGQTFQVSGDDTVESVVQRINGAVGETDVRAEIIGNQIVLTSLEANSDASLNLIVDGDATVLGFESFDEPITGTDPQQARIIINGVTLNSNTNRFTYDGIQIDARQVTDQPVNLSVTRDVDAIFDKLTDFVQAYNELIEKVQEKLGETRYRDYLPLTNEQREQLSDRDIERWEERARSGLIKNDSMISGAMSTFRLDFYNSVEGVGHLSDIGITVGPPDTGSPTRYRDGGKLHIDEAKLREAISSDPDFVMNLFTQSGTSADEATNYKETGLARRLYASLNDAIGQLNTKAGYPTSLSEVDNSLISKQLREIDKRISNTERRLLQVEDRYWRQFTALETAMERLNQQNAWLMSQLSGF